MIIFFGITHILLALSLYFLRFEFDLLVIIAIALGSLFPDIDIETSKLGKYNLFAPFMKHRGKMHTIVISTLISILLYFIDSKFASGFTFGYIIHLIADTFTPMGIMWLYPYKKDYYSLARRFNFRMLEPLIIGICTLFLISVNTELIKAIVLGCFAIGALKVSGKKKKRIKWF